MIYKDFRGMKLSALGLGTMRLPVHNGVNSDIDQDYVDRMVAYSLEQGINYFDTAYGYHGGQSEIAVGKALAKHPRESYYLATKFPGFDPAPFEKIEAIFEDQLRKTGAGYFDFYLFHNVCEGNLELYLANEKNHLFDYLLEQKRNGRIRHLGFSTHGGLECMKKFLDAYGKELEFCQIQLNWLDWDYQEAKKKVELIASYGIPVWVMEPLRGGRLARLDEADAQKVAAIRPGKSAHEIAFRFLQALPEVTMILSGMSNNEQLADNVGIFSTDEPLNEAERNTLATIAHDMMFGIPCTACRYCTAKCPKQLDIPALLAVCNEMRISGNNNYIRKRIEKFEAGKRPEDCIGCRSCEKVCPQNIKISDHFKQISGK